MRPPALTIARRIAIRGNLGWQHIAIVFASSNVMAGIYCSLFIYTGRYQLKLALEAKRQEDDFS
ncbi:hypothetical protein J6590_097155 [Homalodisca vitripennis]|nr:hypothetical protein J6590_097155 [Homalodisca vitripennis]